MPAVTTRTVPRAPGNGSRVTLVVSEVAELRKVGPHGYVHGWIKAGPGDNLDHSKVTDEHIAGSAHDIIRSLKADPIKPVPADDYGPAQGYEASSMIDEAVKRGEAGDYAGMMTQLGTARDSLDRDNLTTSADRLNRMITNAGRVARYKSGQPEPVTRLDRDDFTVPHDGNYHDRSYQRTIENVAAHLHASDEDLHALASEDGRHDTDGLSGDELKESVVAGYIQGWRGSSGGPAQVAMITHVADKLGRPYELADNEKRTNAYIAARPAVQRAAHAIGDAMYDATQEWLKSNGIQNVELHRASRGAEWDKTRPFTSWSTMSGWTREGNTGGTRHESIPAERIFSLPPTGFGTYQESEAVVLPALPGEAAHVMKILQKTAADLSDPTPVEAETIYQQLLANYPPHSIAWVRKLPWTGPVNVPLDQVDWDSVDSWAASHQKKRVKKFQARIRGAGKDVKPVVAVRVPGDDRVKVIDGHHRALAYKAENRPVKAYVGKAPSDKEDAPWFQAHEYQYAKGASSANKAVSSTGNATVKCDILVPVVEVSLELGLSKTVGLPTVWAFANAPKIPIYCESVSFASKSTDGKIKVSLADLVKVGPEGYIHGYICVRPPCGPQYKEAVHDSKTGKVLHGETGEKIGQQLKKEPGDAGYSIRYTGGGDKTSLSGQYATRADAAKAVVLYHNLWALQNGHDGLTPGIAPEMAASITAMRDGDHAGAIQHLENAATTADQAGNRQFSTHARELAMAIRDAPKPVDGHAIPSAPEASKPAVDKPFDTAPHVAAIRALVSETNPTGQAYNQLQNAIGDLLAGILPTAGRTLGFAESQARHSHQDNIADRIRVLADKLQADRDAYEARKTAAMPPGWQKDLLTDPKYVMPKNGYQVTAYSKDDLPLSLHPTAEKQNVPRYFATQREVDDFIRDNASAYRYDEYWQDHAKKKPTAKAKVAAFNVTKITNGQSDADIETRYPGETTDYGDPAGDAVASQSIRFASKVLGLQTEPEQVRAKVSAEVRSQLSHQDSFAPAVVRNTQITVTNDPQTKAGGKKTTLADYRSVYPNPPFHGYMRLTPEIFSAVNKKEADNVMSDSRGTAWWVPTGEKWSLSDVMIAHELGHGVAGKAWGTGGVPQDNRFWMKLSEATGIRSIPGTESDGTVSRKTVDAWIAGNKNVLTSKVSRYGTTNAAELMAELWCEYTMNNHPRATARLYGDAVTAKLKEQDEAEAAA
jgi:ParB/Sulfiredoxin domain